MINLIPPEGHKAVKREYLVRVGATMAFLFGWVCIFLTAALIPTYVLIGAQINTFELESQQEQDKSDAFKQAQAEVALTEAILAQLRSGTSPSLASAAIEEIQRQAPAGIVFRTFQVGENKGVIEKVQIQGVAPTREKLAQLKNALEASSMFTSAEVPLSDLAREADLPFAITVTLARDMTP